MRGALCPLGRFRLGDPVWFRGDPCLQWDSVDPHACFSFLSFHSLVQTVWFSASFFQIGLKVWGGVEKCRSRMGQCVLLVVSVYEVL